MTYTREREINHEKRGNEVWLKNRAWEARAKGKGLRWRLLREIVAFIAKRPFTSMAIQDLMLVHKGISHSKVREMVDELERAKVIKQIQEPEGFYWVATESGVSLFLGSRKAIPAQIVQVVLTLSSAALSEV